MQVWLRQMCPASIKSREANLTRKMLYPGLYCSWGIIIGIPRFFQLTEIWNWFFELEIDGRWRKGTENGRIFGVLATHICTYLAAECRNRSENLTNRKLSIFCIETMFRFFFNSEEKYIFSGSKIFFGKKSAKNIFRWKSSNFTIFLQRIFFSNVKFC